MVRARGGSTGGGASPPVAAPGDWGAGDKDKRSETLPSRLPKRDECRGSAHAGGADGGELWVSLLRL